MAIGKKLLPVKMNLDKASELMQPDEARFIKNMTPYVGANGQFQDINEGFNSGKQKSLQANEEYVLISELINSGNNTVIGSYVSKETNSVFVCVHNDLGNHLIYRLNGGSRTYDIVYNRPYLNFIKKPEYFISEVNITLETVTIGNPETGAKEQRSFLLFTDGENYQKQICVEDSIKTNGFDENLFPYFKGSYDRSLLINMGLATPYGCVKVTEVPWDEERDSGKNNNLLFNTWQFRVRHYDPWGRMSEYGPISQMYVPGINDCIGDNPKLPRCLDLTFDAGNPLVDKIEVAYRNCNSQNWREADTLSLYNGSIFGEWWKRSRNPNVSYNSVTNEITYRFCRNEECRPLSPEITSRLNNPMPRKSQAISKIANYVGLFNNLDGFSPFSNELKSKFSIEVNGPSEAGDSTRNITIYVPIYNPIYKSFQQVFRVDNTYLWGGSNNTDRATRYDQAFIQATQKGFGGYLVGGNSAISTQVYLENGELIEDTTYAKSPVTGTIVPILTKMYFQKFTFTNVPSGNYIFRLYSHRTSAVNNENYRGTSTTVWGVCPFNNSTLKVDAVNRTLSQELLINVCNEDYNSLEDDKILVIADLAATSWKMTSGYIRETTDGIPMELMAITTAAGPGTTNRLVSNITDHNGFYYFGTIGVGRTFVLLLYNKCTKTQICYGEGGEGMRYISFDLTGVNAVTGFSCRPNLNDYPLVECNRILIKGRLVLNNTNIGVSNALVALTRGGSTTTDSDGNFTLIAHDDATDNIRKDKLVISTSACGYKNEFGQCISVIDVSIIPCVSCEERVYPIQDTVLFYETLRGPLSGGVYGIGVSTRDWQGRMRYIQDIGYAQIPSITQSKAIAPSSIIVNIDPSAIFPEDATELSFWITEETTIEDYLTWIVDRVEFIDNKGNINKAGATQIKIYYDSINQFNKQNNFSTTAYWQFITNGETNPRTGDKVQFFINGDGNYFDNVITALVKYDQVGQYFLIDYNDSLKDLTENALIRLVRPKTCTSDTEPYYDLCNSIKIENGRISENSVQLNFFDTYYLSRSIPVPESLNPVNTSVITQTVRTVNNPDGSVSTTTETTDDTSTYVIDNRSFGFLFEHHSPSIFWGYKCKNIGRFNTRNPYEAEIYSINQVALSGGISVNGQLNYLNYFEDSKKTSFDISNLSGGIVGAIFDVGVLLLICQYDQFTVGYNDNLGRINSDGTFQAGSISNEFGKPQRKIGSNNGCLLIDKNTIRRWKGLVTYVDRTNADLVQHNFSDTSSYIENQCVSWFKPKVSELQKDNNRYFIANINPLTNEYYLTDSIISENREFINKERSENPTVSETYSFDVLTKEMRGSFSFIPEYYSYLDNDILNKQFFTFRSGQPYSHYNLNNSELFNVFYGEIVERVIRPVFVMDGFKKLRPLWLELYGNLFFADKIVTDTNQQSRILLSGWEKVNNLYRGAFKCDINTPYDPNMQKETGVNNILDGTPLHCVWADIRLIGDPEQNDRYTQLTGIIIHCYPQNPSGESNS